MRMTSDTAIALHHPKHAHWLHAETEQRINDFFDRFFVDGKDHILHGKLPSVNSVQLISNDYLCLSGEHSLVDAQLEQLRLYKKNAVVSGVFIRDDSPTRRLEKQIATFLKAESGIICQSGWSANISLMQTIASPKIPVYLDMKAHASLWEGANAAGSKSIPFYHNDLAHLERSIQSNGPGILVVESVYSTDGSVCPLDDIVYLAEKYECIIVVDESHSIGTHGPHGAGFVVKHKLQDRVHFRTFSLAKTYAGRGGFITCSERFKAYFFCEARPAIFSSHLLDHEFAWYSEATKFIQAADDRRATLKSNFIYLRAKLLELGYPVSEGSEQIIGLEAGPEHKTRILRDALQDNEIFGSVFLAPATPKNRSLVRLSVNSSITKDQLDMTVEACKKIRDHIGLKNWASVRRKKTVLQRAAE